MLSRHYDSINALRYIVIRILYGDLTLGVWAKVSHYLAFLTDGCKLLHNNLSQIERYRHIIVGFISSITKHHALVASTLIFILFTAHATVDVIALFMDCSKHTTRVAVKLILTFCITYLFDGLASNGLQVNIYIRANFAHNDHLSCSTKCFYGTMSMVIVSQELIK